MLKWKPGLLKNKHFARERLLFCTFAASAGKLPKKLENGSQNDHKMHVNWSRSGENAVHEDMQKKLKKIESKKMRKRSKVTLKIGLRKFVF